LYTVTDSTDDLSNTHTHTHTLALSSKNMIYLKFILHSGQWNIKTTTQENNPHEVQVRIKLKTNFKQKLLFAARGGKMNFKEIIFCRPPPRSNMQKFLDLWPNTPAVVL